MSTGPLYLRRIARRCTSQEPMQIGPDKPQRVPSVPKGMTAAQANAFLRSLPRPAPEEFGLPPFDGREDAA
ncbi:MAG TPA: hypothetical protein PLL33_06830 [Paracoccus sp. (in: a-proteobacteria)]|nr:hypothetical protein [Paracoccus sp. (in: a-proteobacteria)]